MLGCLTAGLVLINRHNTAVLRQNVDLTALDWPIFMSIILFPLLWHLSFLFLIWLKCYLDLYRPHQPFGAEIEKRG